MGAGSRLVKQLDGVVLSAQALHAHASLWTLYAYIFMYACQVSAQSAKAWQSCAHRFT